MMGCHPVFAQGTLAVMDFDMASQPEILCSSRVRDTLIRSSLYQVLPAWHTQTQTHLVSKHHWDSLFEVLAPSEYIVQGVIDIQESRAAVHMIVLQKSPQKIIFAQSRHASIENLLPLCQSMAQEFIGQAPKISEKSPALAATLSFILPGSGHFYLGDPLNWALGAGFFSAYVGALYMGLSGTAQEYITREQWGGVLILVSLTDMLTSYFMAQLSQQ